MYPTVVTEQDSELPLHHVFCFQLKLASFDYIWAGWSCASSSSFQQTWPLPDWCLKEAERFVPRSSSTQAHRAQESPYSDSSALHCRWPAGECSTRLNSMHGSAYSSQVKISSDLRLHWLYCSDPLRTCIVFIASWSLLSVTFLAWCMCGLICLQPGSSVQEVSMGSKQQAWATICCSLVAVFLVTTTMSCKGAGGLDEQEASLFVDSSKSRQIPQTLFGIFFEVTLHNIILFCFIKKEHHPLLHSPPSLTFQSNDPTRRRRPCL